MGLRLALRKAQAEAGDIVLLFADESEALTHPYLARAWAKCGADLRVQAPGQAKKVAMMGALDHTARKLIVHTSRTKRSTDFMALLETLDGLYGPKPGLPTKPVVIVLDNGPIHVSKATTAALAARAHWLTVEWLPKYAPELNDIEVVWHDLKAHHLAHQTFTDAEALDRAIHAAVTSLNSERNVRLGPSRAAVRVSSPQLPQAGQVPKAGLRDLFVWAQQAVKPAVRQPTCQLRHRHRARLRAGERLQFHSTIAGMPAISCVYEVKPRHHYISAKSIDYAKALDPGSLSGHGPRFLAACQLAGTAGSAVFPDDRVARSNGREAAAR